jgi:hypothetical protein
MAADILSTRHQCGLCFSVVRPTPLSHDGSYHMDHDGGAAVASIIGHLRSVLSGVHGFRSSGFALYR